jgi:hypothetical protein
MPSVAAYIPLQRHIIKSVQINRSTAPEGISKICVTGLQPMSYDSTKITYLLLKNQTIFPVGWIKIITNIKPVKTPI